MFDPFGDFETAGYLRNELGLKDPAKIQVQEHLFFTANIEEAATYLARCRDITYRDFCSVHGILFAGFYPWAGKDRLTLNVARNVSKGARVDFESSENCERAIAHGLRLGSDPKVIAKRPGEVMGMFAWGHPFLDGNGRTMVTVHTELMARAGLMIDWTASRKDAYLDALTHELDSPSDRALDKYLLPLVQPLQKGRSWIAQIRDLPGLDGAVEDIGTDVAYNDDDPVGQQRYQEKVRARRYTLP
ncbi:Fic/DOC family protein [Roseateles sp.]|uniref:Fic/DOC family protein n=1 Tax=Roseateles sp. TaxID=1971397 RepID=UPI0039E9BD1F